MTGDRAMTTREVQDAVEREHRRLMESVRALGDRAVVVDVTEGWTAKDVLAHATHWVSQIAFGMGAKLTPPSYVIAAADKPSGEEWNRRAVEHYRQASLDDVVRDLDRLVDALTAQIKLRTDTQMAASDAIPWSTDPLWKQISSETFGHWPAHSADIERAVGTT